MTDESTNLPERAGVIEQKLDGFIRSADARFDQVDAAIVELRAYSEFAYEWLDSTMDAGFARLDQKIDDGLGRVDGRFDRLERKIDQIIDLHLPRTPRDNLGSE